MQDQSIVSRYHQSEPIAISKKNNKIRKISFIILPLSYLTPAISLHSSHTRSGYFKNFKSDIKVIPV